MAKSSSQQNFIRKIIGSRMFLFLACLILIALAISVGRESYRKYQLTKEINQLKSEIDKLEGSNQQLADLMQYFKEDSYLEKEARLKLNLRREGERVVILPSSSDKEPASNVVNSSEPVQKKEENNWWKWWEYFFADK